MHHLIIWKGKIKKYEKRNKLTSAFPSLASSLLSLETPPSLNSLVSMVSMVSMVTSINHFMKVVNILGIWEKNLYGQQHRPFYKNVNQLNLIYLEYEKTLQAAISLVCRWGKQPYPVFEQIMSSILTFVTSILFLLNNEGLHLLLAISIWRG